ncbi:FbpB family small basic protein [Sporolactobacillus shoreae]|uniref:FbpB family small basic protein n=1 Tax=Sporolactobacillus shoreae TaxID=1465501 RepID=A0A4Z0GUM1_9BACL|nr:FbpB family small basic protein [Sporolactobacillus shoreae]TGB00408.1 FbpB family small basic protein [Sporolactobacillus shoreae]
MRKKQVFKELVLKNKSEILRNEKVLEKIEEKIDQRHAIK